MVFEADGKGYGWPLNRKDIVLIPLYDRAPKKIKTGCAFCLSFDHNDKANCPHIYFTAWNELYCLSPKVEVRLAEPGEYDLNLRFWIGYEIKKYSANDNNWIKACELNVPQEYHYERSPSFQTSSQKKPLDVCYLEFQIVHRETHLLLAMVNERGRSFSHPVGYYVSVMQLTPDSTSGMLMSEVKLNKQITKEAVQLFPKSIMTASSFNLRFQEISKKNGRITELNMKSGAIRALKADDDMLNFPKHKLDDERPDFIDRKFVTSRKNGFLYHIDNVLPYINVMWSFDLMRNKWKSLPGPPRDEKVFGADLQIVPSQLLADIKAYPATIFEDTSCNGGYGPFSDLYEESLSDEEDEDWEDEDEDWEDEDENEEDEDEDWEDEQEEGDGF